MNWSPHYENFVNHTDSTLTWRSNDMADSLQEQAVAASTKSGEAKRYDVVVIGAGVTGLYALYRM